MNKNGKEKRKYRRYLVPEGAFGLGPGEFYKIIDVSEGGLRVVYSGKQWPSEEVEVRILIPGKDAALGPIRCRKVSDEQVGPVRLETFMANRCLRLEFVKPDPEIVSQLLVSGEQAKDTQS